MKRNILVLLAFFAAVSCTVRETGRDTIGLVKAIAADSDGPEHKLLASFSKVPSSGDIYIVGSPGSCAMISREFLECDVFENARGRLQKDGLKDFAGETFAGMYDEVFTPYEAYAAASDPGAVRHLAVNYALAALSPTCSMSFYDLDGNKEKNPAKMIVLADPWLLYEGKFDIDTLFTLTGCKVPVVSPTALLMDAAFGGEKKYFNVGILCDSTHIAGGVYRAVFEAAARERDIVGARCFTAANPSEGGAISAFFDAYMEAGNTEPLDVLLIDDWSVDMEAVRNKLDAVRDFNREEYLLYGKLLSPDFTVFCSSELTMTTCYGILRDRSLFTHRIAPPVSAAYQVKLSPEASDKQFLLIPSENVQD